MRLSVAAATALLLAACGQTTTPSVPPATGGAQVPSAPAGAATAPVQARYAIGDTEVVFRHALRLADADGRLRLLLTPGPLPEELLARMRDHEAPGLFLLHHPAEGHTDRHPHLVIEMQAEGTYTPDNLRYFFVLAGGILERYHADNISRTGANHGVEALEMHGEHVRLRGRGTSEIEGVPRRWEFDIRT